MAGGVGLGHLNRPGRGGRCVAQQGQSGEHPEGDHRQARPRDRAPQSRDPARFLRIHRSAIVRLDLVESLERGQGGESEVRLKNGVRLRVSRSRREALERWLGRTS